MTTSSSKRTWRIGLTGGIGSGKSTVASMLSDLGAAVIDADAISRSLTAPGGLAIPALREQFGAAMIAADGGLDRQAMRERVFANADARHQLEAIIHPLVSQLTDAQVKQALQNGAHCLVFDVPLLVEHSTRWLGRLDRVLVIDCPEQTQIARVMARSGLHAAEVQGIIRQQASRSQRLACADAVISNDGLTLQELLTEVRELARHFGL